MRAMNEQWQLVKTLGTALGAVYAVATLVINGFGWFDLGLPIQVHVAIGLGVFFLFMYLLVRPLLVVRRTAYEVVEQSGQDVDRIGVITRQIISDSRDLKEKEQLLEKHRKLTHPALLLAVQQMYLHHGHSDIHGLHRAWVTGESFNAEDCWRCGKPRFQEPAATDASDMPIEK